MVDELSSSHCSDANIIPELSIGTRLDKRFSSCALTKNCINSLSYNVLSPGRHVAGMPVAGLLG